MPSSTLHAVPTLAIPRSAHQHPGSLWPAELGGSPGNVILGCAASPWAGIHLFPASIFRLLAPRETPLFIFGKRCLKCFPFSVRTVSVSYTINLSSRGWHMNGEIDPGRTDSTAERGFFLTGANKEYVSLTSFQLTSVRSHHPHQLLNWQWDRLHFREIIALLWSEHSADVLILQNSFHVIKFSLYLIWFNVS